MEDSYKRGGSQAAAAVNALPFDGQPPSGLLASPEASGTERESYFKISIARPSATDPVGLMVRHEGNEGLMVEEIIEGGAIHRHNGTCPEQQVFPGDRVYKVNAVEGDAAMLVEEVRRDVPDGTPLVLEVCRALAPRAKNDV